jgi:oligopeptide transport system substrate-binding protein
MRSTLGSDRSWLALALALAATACARGAEGYYGTTEPKHGLDEIWTNMSSEPEYIDPGKCSDSAGGMVISNIFAALIEPHPQTLEPLPGIAERWEISPDGRRYTFYLRQSRWSDGVPLTAADFEYAWKRVLDPATGSKYGTYLYPLRHAEAFASRALMVRGVSLADEAELRGRLGAIGKLATLRMDGELAAAFAWFEGDDAIRSAARQAAISQLHGATLGQGKLSVSVTDASVVGVRAVEPHVLVVELEDPLPYFLDMIGYYVTAPVPRHVIERLARAGKNTDLWTRPEHIVSNGAYVLGETKFRQFMWFDKNPHYWDAKRVRTPRIRASVIESYNTALNMYEAGELDTIGSNTSLPAEFMERLERYRDFHRAGSMTTYMYWLNVKAPPLDDVRVRTALRLSIERDAIVKHITRAGQTPTADLVPGGLGGYVGPRTPMFDPVRARGLLAEAGYGGAKPLPKITLIYNTSEGHKQLALAVQAMWRKHLGIEIEIENQEWKVFLKNLESMSFQVARMGWVGDYPDPYTFLELLRSDNGNNHSHWRDSTYDDLLRRANALQEPRARHELLRSAEARIAQFAPIVPLFVYTRSEMTKPYLKGHAINYQTRAFFKYWWIDRRWYDGAPTSELPDGFPAARLAPPEELRP